MINKKTKRILYFAAIMVVTLVLQYPDFKEYLVLDRDLFLSGQYWRLITGNIVHTNIYHWLMNILALFLMFVIFKPKIKEFEIIGFVLSVLVGTGIIIGTEIETYYGLSGMLHGVFAYYVIKDFFANKEKRTSLIMATLLVIKLVSEQIWDINTGTELIIQANVATEAHLYGALSGVIIGLIFSKKQKEKAV